jgi:eukaryotic-like serine/threonine-protein kinase
MVTERKAFEREDVESLRQSILDSTPVAPVHVSPKVHPLLSDLILKALAKDPAERYQNARELLDDLEKCKESKPAAAKKPEAAKSPVVANKPNAAAQAKFAGQAPAKPAATPSKPAAPRPTQPASSVAEIRSGEASREKAGSTSSSERWSPSNDIGQANLKAGRAESSGSCGRGGNRRLNIISVRNSGT